MVSIKEMISPGVFIDEIDLSTYVAIMDTTKVFGIVTLAQNGPIGEVIDITSVDDYEDTLGYPISAGGLAAVEIAGITSSLKVVRLAGSSAAYRTAKLAGVSAGESGSAITEAVTVAYKNKGTLFSDAIRATVKAIEGATADKFKLIITKGEDDSEIELVNKDFTIVAANATTDFPYLIGNEDTDFRFALATTTELGSLTPVEDVTFTAGDNGLTFTDDQVRDAIDVFDDSENIDLDILSAPGLLTPAAQLRLIKVAEHRKDCFAVLDPPQGLTPAETAEYVNGTNTSYPISKLDSSYAGIWSPWGKVYNEYSGAFEWVPPSVGVLPAMANEYHTYYNWTPPAGIPRFEITNFSELERILKRTDRDVLYASHINPLCNYKMQGLTAFGQKTLQRKKSALDRINARFATNYVKKMADFASIKYLFMDIDETTFEMWTSEMKKNLTTMMLNGGLYDFKVTMDWTTVTDEMLNNNIMPGIIQIKTKKTAEFIPIDVILRNRSDDFS